MIVAILYLIITLCLFNFYQKHEYKRFVCLYSVMMTSGYAFLPAPSVKITDFMLILFIGIYIHEKIHNNNLLSVKNDKFAMFTLLLISYYFFIFLKTFLLGDEPFSNCFKVFRTDLWLLQYFIFKRIPYSEIKKSYRFIFILTTIAGLFYFLQFIGITGILNFSDESTASIDGFSRRNNAPTFTLAILSYLIFLKIKMRFKILWIAIYFSMFILPMVRGAYIAFGITILLYFMINRDIKKIFKIAIYCFCAMLFFYPILEARFTNKNGEISTSEDIKMALNTKSQEYSSNKGGSFYYRISLLRERIDYLVDNNKLLMGVGTIHEASSQNTFPLYVGKSIYDNRSALIDTNDISFVTRFFRYGLIYLLLFLLYLIYGFKVLLKNKNFEAGKLGFILLGVITFQCLGSDGFSMQQIMLKPIILIACCNNITNYKNDRNSYFKLQQQR